MNSRIDRLIWGGVDGLAINKRIRAAAGRLRWSLMLGAFLLAGFAVAAPVRATSELAASAQASVKLATSELATSELVRPAPAASVSPGAASDFQIVESVPEHSIYEQSDLPRTQQVWLQMIRGAHHSIDIAAFYIANQARSQLVPVLDALVTRAEAGVKVRLLVDQTFLKTNPDSVERLRQVPGIAVRVLPVDTLTGGVLHAKFFVVDGENVFVGSQNWDWRALDQIHEIGARIRSARFAKTFVAAFDFDWHLAAHPDLPNAAKAAVTPPDFVPVTAEDPVLLHADGETLTAYPAFSPPSMMPRWVTSEQHALERMIDASTRVLRIQVMTFSALSQYGPKGWWSPLDAAIRDAAARGVQVRIIVADWALHEPMQAYLKSLAVLPDITVKFSTVPESPEGFIAYARVEHAKYAVADDRSVYIGTGNWERSYFDSSVDTSVFVSGRGPARTLSQIFDHDWSGPYVTTIKAGDNYAPARNH